MQTQKPKISANGNTNQTPVTLSLGTKIKNPRIINTTVEHNDIIIDLTD